VVQTSEKLRKRNSKNEDLDEELLGKEVEVALQNGGILKGRLVASSNYWVKIELSGKHVYVNKPHIVLIKPS